MGHGIAVDVYLCASCGTVRLMHPSDARRASVEGYWSKLRERAGHRRWKGADVLRSAEQASARRVQAIEFRRTGRTLKLDLGDGVYQVYNHRDAPVEFNEQYYDLLQTVVDGHEGRLIKLANLYQEKNRDFYSFLYDLVAMVYFTSKLPDGFRRLLEKDELKSEGDLLHNRILVQLAGHFQKRCRIELNHRSNKAASPDLTIDNLDVEVKTIIGRYAWTPDSVAHLSRKIKEKYNAGMRQTGDGAVFISFWSIYMNNLFRDNFWRQYASVPYPPRKGRAYFVLDGRRAFEDYYTTGDVYSQIEDLPSCDLLKRPPFASPSPYGDFTVTRAGFTASMQTPPDKAMISFSMG